MPSAARSTASAVDSGARQIALARSWDDVDALREDWDRLWALAPKRRVFTSSAWSRAWLRAYAAKVEPRVVSLRIDGRVRAIVPLVLERRRLRLLGAPEADYGDLLAEPGSALDGVQALTHALFHRLRHEWDRLELENVPEDSQLFRAIAEAPAAVRRMSGRMALVCPATVSRSSLASVP